MLDWNTTENLENDQKRQSGYLSQNNENLQTKFGRKKQYPAEQKQQ